MLHIFCLQKPVILIGYDNYFQVVGQTNPANISPGDLPAGLQRQTGVVCGNRKNMRPNESGKQFYLFPTNKMKRDLCLSAIRGVRDV